MSHFIDALRQIDAGSALASIDEQLIEVLKAVRETGKKGAVAVSIAVQPNGDRGFEVTANVTAKAPQHSFGRSFFYTDRNGHLTRTPPDLENDGLLSLVDGDKKGGAA